MPPTLPSASQVIDETSGAFATQTGLCVVMGCVGQNADSVPRVFSSTQGILAQHGYAQAVDYAAMHFDEPNKPVIFIGMPVTTAGIVKYIDNTLQTGTANLAITADTNGIMEEVAGQITGVQGSVLGTDQIIFDLSCDGGLTKQRIRLSTALVYKIPNMGIVLTFEAGGTLNAGDVINFQTSAPMWGSTAISTARTNLAAQQSNARTWMVVGDLPNSTFAGYVTTETNGYETQNSRFIRARVQVSDRGPLPTKSTQNVNANLSAATTISFDSVAHTITRSAGSFITDGFAIGQVVKVTGATAPGDNGVIGALTNVSATVLTFGAGLVTEGPDNSTGITIQGSPGLTFAAAGHTITRAGGGNFLNEGFATGQSVTISGTSSNNVTLALTNVSSTVLTFGSGLANEGPLMDSSVTIQQSLTLGAWINAQSAAFAAVDGQRRIDVAAGRGRKQSPVNGWIMRRPAAWAASLREYQHDLQIPCWRKDDGPLDGWSLVDSNGNKVEFDEAVDGGGLAGRFTCFRSWSNGPKGAFIALSLTRDTDGLILSRSQNMDVVDLAQAVVQDRTESLIGQVGQLNKNGTATETFLRLMEKRVNKALQVNLLQNFLEGPRASNAVWTASRTDVLSAPGSTLNGTLELNFNGTIEHVATRIRVN